MPSNNSYTRVFHHLSHMVALSKEGKTQAAIDSLVATVFAVNKQLAPSTIEEISTAINVYFGLSLTDRSIQESVDRHLQNRRLFREGTSQVFFLSPEERARIEAKIQEANTIEKLVRQEWLQSLEEVIQVIPSDCDDQLWQCLRSYMAKAFRRHGAQTVQLLNPALPISDENKQSLSSYLEEAIQERCDAMPASVASTAVQHFFRENTPLRTKYVTQLLDGTFTFFALSVDEATSAYLRGALSPLSLFLDTNFIFGVLRLHTNPLNEVSEELVEVIRKNNFPFKLYYHEATLQELQRTVLAIAEGLKRRKWTQALSRTAVKYGQLTGIERQYHEKNAIAPIDPKIFLSKYEHITELLAEHDFTIYRSPKTGKERDEERYRLVAEYKDILDKRRRPKAYEAINHDIVVWQAVRYLRKPGASALNAGAFFLTADYSFYTFDWQTLRTPPNLGLVVLPNQFLQLLRPFIPITDDFDRRFFETFAIPEFRTINSDYTTTYSKVLAFMSTYEDVSEATASRMLADEMLMDQLREVPEDSEDFTSLIESALIQDNAQLLQEKEALQAQVEDALIKAAQNEVAAREKAEQLRLSEEQHALIETRAKILERERLAQLEHTNKLQAEADAKAQAQAEALRRLQAEADAKAQAQAEALRRLQAEADAKAQAQAEALRRLQADRDRYAFWSKLVVGIVFAVIAVSAIFLVPVVWSWKWLNDHPNRLGLYGFSIAIVLSLAWLIGDGNRKRGLSIVALVGIPSILGLLTIIGS